MIARLDSIAAVGSLPTRDISVGGHDEQGNDTRWSVAVRSLGQLLIPAQANADDKTTGVLAGLGVVAAGGKTTLGNGAGAIEAGLLGIENFERAGAIVTGVVDGLVPGQKILVVTHDEKVDLASWHLVADRLGQITNLIDKGCRPKGTTSPPPPGPQLFMQPFPSGTKLLASDFIGAGLTDVGISGIALTADDRLLVTALLMNTGATVAPLGDGWIAEPGPGQAPSPAVYSVAGDTTALPTGGTTKAAYDKLIDLLDHKRSECSQTDDGKAILSTADALVNGLNAAGATGIPLVNAMQLEQVSAGTKHVLRIAVEQVGGTSIARTGIPYTFGWPNAATVGAGLLVSFRLTNPVAGTTEALGFVRCLQGQTNLKRVSDVMQRQDGRGSKAKPQYAIGQAVCDYRVVAPALPATAPVH